MKIPVAALPETRAWILASTTLLVLCSLASPALTEAENPWGGYLDYAYVYSSAQPEALRGRLDEYGAQAGMTLEAYVTQEFEARRDLDEHALRRKAIAYLLVYLASGDSNPLDISVASVRDLEAHLGRHENRYWYHYILAHEALEARDPGDFVANVLELWLHVVTPLEAPYETLRTLSLSHSASAGFASALPYVFENLTRLILIRTQEMRLDRGLDALGAVVRMLHDGRVGQHPDVIPREASSFGYLDRIVRRLNGPESDSGSLTFTLALFEARKVHDRARSLLATEGLSPDAMEVFHVATGAYQDTLERARMVQGHTAVFTRGLRQLGEMYAAKQRLGVDRDVETPFTISKAMQVYGAMYEVPERGWERLGYRSSGREGYLDGMRGLWQEIQEASLNAAAYHLSRSLEAPHRAPQHVRSAASIYARYLDFFERYATGERREAVPDSAYFAAYDAARGYGDAFLAYPSAASSTTRARPCHSALRAGTAHLPIRPRAVAGRARCAGSAGPREQLPGARAAHCGRDRPLPRVGRVDPEQRVGVDTAACHAAGPRGWTRGHVPGLRGGIRPDGPGDQPRGAPDSQGDARRARRAAHRHTRAHERWRAAGRARCSRGRL